MSHVAHSVLNPTPGATQLDKAGQGNVQFMACDMEISNPARKWSSFSKMPEPTDGLKLGLSIGNVFGEVWH